MANEGLFSLNRDSINNMDEITLFFNIRNLSQYISEYKYFHVKGLFKNINIDKEELILNYMIAQTVKFGVEVDFDENGNLNSSESYREWINFYENHFSNVLSNEELLFFKNAFIMGEIINELLPENNWIKEQKKVISR